MTEEYCPVCGDEIEERDDSLVTLEGVCCSDECYEEYQQPRAPWDDETILIDGVGFADPGGHSALRAETKDNPRNLPCPKCKRPNMLTPIDRSHGYQCDFCADIAERGGY